MDAVREHESLACRRAAQIFTCSDADVDRLRELFGAPDERFAVVANGYDAGAIAFTDLPERSALRRSVGIGPLHGAVHRLLARTQPGGGSRRSSPRRAAMPDATTSCSSAAPARRWRTADVPANVDVTGPVHERFLEAVLALCRRRAEPDGGGLGHQPEDARVRRRRRPADLLGLRRARARHEPGEHYVAAEPARSPPRWRRSATSRPATPPRASAAPTITCRQLRLARHRPPLARTVPPSRGSSATMNRDPCRRRRRCRRRARRPRARRHAGRAPSRSCALTVAALPGAVAGCWRRRRASTCSTPRRSARERFGRRRRKAPTPILAALARPLLLRRRWPAAPRASCSCRPTRRARPAARAGGRAGPRPRRDAVPRRRRAARRRRAPRRGGPAATPARSTTSWSRQCATAGAQPGRGLAAARATDVASATGRRSAPARHRAEPARRRGPRAGRHRAARRPGYGARLEPARASADRARRRAARRGRSRCG